MSETDDFAHVQRRLCAVIAKSEWTSSRMRMQKSGDELRERRAKTHRTANQFLQDLFEKRTDQDLIDDHGAVDRYHKFVKYKSDLNDDGSDTLSEFDRRLRALNHQRHDGALKNNQTYADASLNRTFQPETNELSYDESESVQETVAEERPKLSRVLPSIASIPVTSTPNDTTNDLLNPIFQDEEDDTSFRDFSQVQSKKPSPANLVLTSIKSFVDPQQSSSTSEPVATLHTSTLSMTQTLFRPKARRPDGTEPVVVPAPPSQQTSSSSSTVPWNQLTFPRALTTRGKLSVTITSKRQLPLLPRVRSSPEQKRVPDEQFDSNQLYQLLDHLDEHSNRSSPADFITMLDQLSLSPVLDSSLPPSISQESSNDQQPSDDADQIILPEFFDHPLPTAQEKRFYTTFAIPLNDPTTLRLYVMTCSIVQFSASIYVPYSVLAGRRPVLASSKQTSFTPVRSKRKNYTCQVTAVESSFNLPELQPNDILLKINDQPVWRLTTDSINELLRQYCKRSTNCSLTIARLCQPFV